LASSTTELIDGARALIEKGKSAGYAWRAVLRDGIDQLGR